MIDKDGCTDVVARRIGKRGVGVLAEGPHAELPESQGTLLALGNTPQNWRGLKPVVDAEQVCHEDLRTSACDSAAFSVQQCLQRGLDSGPQMERRSILPRRESHERHPGLIANLVRSECSVENCPWAHGERIELGVSILGDHLPVWRDRRSTIVRNFGGGSLRTKASQAMSMP